MPELITGDADGSVTEAGGILNGTPGIQTDTGDLDSSGGTNDDTWQAVAPGGATANGYGTYALSAEGVWVYSLNNNNAAVQALNGAATLTDTFTALTEDGTARLVTVTIHAQNDAAVITGDATGSVTEAGGVLNGTPGTATDTGDLNAADVDNIGDSWQAVAPGGATANGYGTYALSAAGVWVYSLDDGNAAVQALNGAATLTDRFTARTEDGTARLVTVTIHAQNDAAVITGDATGSVTEAGGVLNGTPGTATDTGDLDSTDVDNPTDAWQAVAPGGATASGYGTYALSAAGIWIYTLDDSNAAVQALNGAATLTDTFMALTADGTARLVTVTIHAQNDTAAITGDAAGSVTEAGGVLNGTPGTATDTGDLHAADVDNNADSWQAVAPGGATAHGYGTYALSAAGAWVYSLDDSNAAVQGLNGSDTLTDTFMALTEDGTSRLVTVTIHAQNDAAAITGDATASVTEAGGVFNGTPGTQTGTGDLNDTDVDNVADSWQAVAPGGATTNSYGTYALSASGVWIYTLDDSNAAVQALNGSDILTDTFTALTEDGTSQLVTVTIHAQNDAAAITGDATGSVTEAGGVLNGTPGTATDTGDLDAADVDNAADAWQAVAPGGATAHGYGTYALSAAGVWVYSLDDSNAAVQALNGSDTLTDTFMALSEGGTAQLVTVTIHAQNDAAVITGDATGSVTEAGGVLNGTPGTQADSGDLDAADVDNNADSWQAVAPGGTTAHGYGTYALSAAGIWVYTLDDSNAAVQALNGAATLTDTFTALTEDGTSRLVTVTIHAQNDAAVITGDATGSVTEAGEVLNGTPGTQTDTGDLSDTDVDNAADTWQPVAPGGVTTNQYGTYELDAAGVWIYTLDDSNAAVQALNGAATLTDTFMALTEDGTSQLVTVTIHAQNDAAVITGDATGSVTEAGGTANGTPGVHTDTGDLNDTDVDNPADTWQAVAPGGTTANGYGTYELDAAGVWVYTLDDSNAAVQALNGAATLTDTFMALTEDGTAQLVTVTIHAQNDAAVITGDATGSVTEAGGVLNGTPGTATDTGDLDAADVDNIADTWQAVAPGGTAANGYGTYELDAAGVWVYTLDDNNAAVQGLNGAATLTDMFTVLTGDGTAQLITVTIHAQNDAATTHDDAVATDEATVLAGNLFSNNGSGADSDVDGPPLSVSEVNGSGANVGVQITLASGAHLTVSADGTLSYDPNHAFDTTPTAGSGAANTPALDSFTYTLTGGGTATVSVTINGLDSNDTLIGTAADDTLNGGIGADIVNALGGNDLINGGAGADTMTGGSGNDTYVVDDAGDQVIEASGGGNDIVYTVVSYGLAAGSEVELLSAFSTGWTIDMNLTGNEFDNVIVGTQGANIIYGGGGLDVLVGLGGNDTYVVNGTDVVFEGANGGTDVTYAISDYTLGGGSHVELLSAYSIAWTIDMNLTGNELDNLIVGTQGANILYGGAGGADVLVGLGGNDTYIVSSEDIVFDGDADGGNDTVYAIADYVLTAGQYIETLSAFSIAWTSDLNLTGNSADNRIIGTMGANVLDGKEGNDYLVGFDGADSFAFTTALNATANADKILGFEVGVDKILLDHSVFATLGLGGLSASAFVTGAAAQDADDRIIYNSATAQIFYDVDGNGAGAAVLFATMVGTPALQASDFTVI